MKLGASNGETSSHELKFTGGGERHKLMSNWVLPCIREGAEKVNVEIQPPNGHIGCKKLGLNQV